MIKNIIFDLGNVLLVFKPKAFLGKIFPHQEEVDLYYQYIFASKEWSKLDQGLLTEKEGIDIFIGRYPSHSSNIRYIFNGWKDSLKPMEET